MPARVAGCIVGFSDDVQRSIPEMCALCKTTTARWFPWPGVWLCTPCFNRTDSVDLKALVKRLEVVKNDKS